MSGEVSETPWTDERLAAYCKPHPGRCTCDMCRELSRRRQDASVNHGKWVPDHVGDAWQCSCPGTWHSIKVDACDTCRLKAPAAVPAPAKPEMVNHPRHYNTHPSGIEAIVIVEHMSFNVGSAMKYLWRADEKGAPIEDLRKAIWYIQREIERREKSGK